MASWLDSEVQMWSFFMLREQFPMYITTIVHVLTGIYNQGLFSIEVLVSLALFPATRFFYTRVATMSVLKRRFGLIFMYYQVIQVFHLYKALATPEEFYLYVISSTILLVHCEITPLLGTTVSLLLVAKHFLLWHYCLWRLISSSHLSLEACITMTWSFFHLWNYIITKRDTLVSGFDSMQELRREQERTQALLQAVPDGVLVLTQAQQVITYNQTLLKMLQIESDFPIESKLLATLTRLEYATNYKKHISAHTSLLSDIIDNIRTKTEATCIDFGSVLHCDYYLEWRGTVTLWNQQKVCILTVRNVGKWVELERLARKESSEKSALIRSVSHELRTPINAIINVSERVLDTEMLTNSGKELCQVLISSSNMLLSTVNDLLDCSRMVNERFSMNKQLFSLKNAVESCVKLIQPQCRLKKLDLTLRIDPSIPQMAYNDPNRVKQVLLNLLSNALKFTLKGKIEVVAVMIGTNKAKISVSDSGIGISKENIGKLFKLFGKIEGNEHLNAQGCGLGLTISYALVRSMGGNGIEVTSSLGLGAEFAFIIPISDLDSEQEVAESDEIWESDFEENVTASVLHHSKELWRDPRRQAAILIVDDAEFNRLVLRDMLESLGLRADEAFTGLDAVRKVETRDMERNPYRLIFMDIEMPEMNGIEATRVLHRGLVEGRLTYAPVVVGCSAYVTAEDRENCLRAGMDFFLEKPVSKASLQALCARIAL